MPETDEMDLEFVRRAAEARGYYVGVHRNYDPTRGGGDLFLQRKKKFRDEHQDSILKYSTDDQIYQWLNENAQ